jgi:hypothetical protein
MWMKPCSKRCCRRCREACTATEAYPSPQPTSHANTPIPLHSTPLPLHSTTRIATTTNPNELRFPSLARLTSLALSLSLSVSIPIIKATPHLCLPFSAFEHLPFGSWPLFCGALAWLPSLTPFWSPSWPLEFAACCAPLAVFATRAADWTECGVLWWFWFGGLRACLGLRVWGGSDWRFRLWIGLVEF